MKSINDLGLIRVASVSTKVAIADTDYNTNEIIKTTNQLIENKVQVAVFPELSITAYTCGDLFLQKLLIDRALSSLIKIKNYSIGKEIVIIVGLPLSHQSKLYNVAAVIFNGSILGIIPKQYLCNHKEFYEKRWFSSSTEISDNQIIIDNELVLFTQNIIFRIPSVSNANFAVEICEDLWAISPPSISHSVAGANIIFNLSASNEYIGKHQYRKDLIKIHSSKIIGAYIYSSASSLESTSDTIFSGSLLIAESGKILLESDRFNFESKYLIYDIDVNYLNQERIKNKTFASSIANNNYYYTDIDLNKSETSVTNRKISKTPFIPDKIEEINYVCQEITDIQANGLIRRLLHTNISKVILGLSGGLDSTLALLSIIKAFDKMNLKHNNIVCVTMPGFGTTTKTKTNATELAKLLGVTFLEIDIRQSVNQHFKDIGHSIDKLDITYENAQARMRTLILMDIANQKNGLVIGTGDLSEIALGWSTYNGDQMSMYGLNSGIPKTLIRYIIEWYYSLVYSGKISEILKDIVNTPISPELLPSDSSGEISQWTEKAIGPYILNDFFLYHFIRNYYEPKKILEFARIAFKTNYTDNEIKYWLKNFIKRFFSQQFKRNTSPDGIKVGSVSLSQRADWKMPSEASMNNWIEDLEGIE